MLNVNVITNIQVTKFANKAVYFKNRSEENADEDIVENVDTFILATGVTSNRDLANSFKNLIPQNSINNKIPKMKFIGDSRKDGTILEAVRDGFKAAYKLGKFK